MGHITWTSRKTHLSRKHADYLGKSHLYTNRKRKQEFLICTRIGKENNLHDILFLGKATVSYGSCICITYIHLKCIMHFYTLGLKPIWQRWAYTFLAVQEPLCLAHVRHWLGPGKYLVGLDLFYFCCNLLIGPCLQRLTGLVYPSGS